MEGRLIIRNAAPLRRRDYVLYWMTASRRASWNFALQHAAGLARAQRRPLPI